jgi:hypothetical protein
MGISHLDKMTQPKGDPLQADIDDAPLDWTALKALMDANAASQRAMEEYLYHACLGNADGQAGVDEFIEQSIERHEAIIEHLELASAVVGGPEAQPHEEQA